jgi:iron complex outermembrane recepter protein
LRRNQRSFLDCAEEFLTFENGGRADIVDARTGRPACNGVIGNLVLTNNDFTGPGFSPGLLGPNGRQAFISQFAVGGELNGIGFPINGRQPGVVAPANFFGLNFDGPSTGVLNQYLAPEQFSDVVSSLKRFTIFADASYELTDGIEIYSEALFNNRKTFTNGIQQVSTFQFTGNSVLPFFFCDPTVNNCDPFDAGDPFNNEFAGNFLLRPLVVQKADSGTDVDYYRGVFGARGKFGGFLNDWDWDVYGQYSKSQGEYFQDATLADSIASQDFRTFSCAGQTTAVAGRQCIDIDWTDPRVLRGEFNDAERAFLFTRDVGNTAFKQLTGEATLSGNLFKLPAGQVGTALGVQIRRDEINDVPGEASQAGNLFNLTSAGITAGRTVTKEVFGELEVPIIYDTPLIQRFAISGAGRYTKVNATRRDGARDSFSDSTWKVGFDWEVTDWLRFRGSWGTSFRAPALFELFLENQTGFRAQQDIDVCINTAQGLANGTITQRIFDNCAAAGIPPNFQGATGGALIVSGGGLGALEPEASTAKTISAILTPKGWIWGGGRASLAVDYFDIDVNDEITTLGAGNIVIGCYNSEFFPNEPLCDQIDRIPAGATDALNISTVRDTFININNQRNKGIDVTGRFTQDLGKWGALSFTAQMTWQLKDTLQLFEGTLIELNGEVGDPRWVGDFNVTWNKGGTTLFYGLDVIGKADNREDLIDDQGALCRTSVFRPGGRFCPDVSVPAVFYHSASITQEVNDKFQLTLGVANLTNRKPPRVSTVFNGGISTLGQVPVFGSQYDYLGRRIFLSVQGSF